METSVNSKNTFDEGITGNTSYENHSILIFWSYYKLSSRSRRRPTEWWGCKEVRADIHLTQEEGSKACLTGEKVDNAYQSIMWEVAKQILLNLPGILTHNLNIAGIDEKHYAIYCNPLFQSCLTAALLVLCVSLTWALASTVRCCLRTLCHPG